MTGSVVHDNGRSLIVEDRGQRHKEHSYVLLRHAALEYLVVQDTDVGRHRHQKRDVAATLGAHHAVHPFADPSPTVGAPGVQIEAGFVQIHPPAAMSFLHHPLGVPERMTLVRVKKESYLRPITHLHDS